MKRRSGNKFVILVLLTKSPGRFISKDELLTAIGGHEFGPHHSIVDTCITYLDRLLQEADGSPTIEKAHVGQRPTCANLWSGPATVSSVRAWLKPRLTNACLQWRAWSVAETSLSNVFN